MKVILPLKSDPCLRYVDINGEKLPLVRSYDGKRVVYHLPMGFPKELIELIFGPEAEIAESWRRYEDNRPRRKQIELAFE